MSIVVPKMKDEFTNMTDVSDDEPYADKIYMDSMHFGMGCTCLQVTFETVCCQHA